MLKKLNQLLNIVMGAFAGIYIGHCIYKCWHFGKFPELYAMQSAPWYTSIWVDGILTLILLLVCMLIKLILKRKMKQ